MNLDALYSELTLKTNAKVALVVMDGVGDVATREQGYLTPLDAAVTPNLDALARGGARGRMIRVAPGITPGGGAGTGTVDGVAYELDKLDCLYAGRGSKSVTF